MWGRHIYPEALAELTSSLGKRWSEQKLPKKKSELPKSCSYWLTYCCHHPNTWGLGAPAQIQVCRELSWAASDKTPMGQAGFKKGG